MSKSLSFLFAAAFVVSQATIPAAAQDKARGKGRINRVNGEEKMKMNTKHSRRLKATLVLFAWAATLFASQEAVALTLKLQSGATTITIGDNTAGDADSTVGVVVFNGSIENFSVVVAAALSKPLIGSAAVARLDLVNVSVTNHGEAGTLIVSATDTDFGSALATGGTILTSLIGGTTDGTTTFQSYLDAANTPFATAGLTVCTFGAQGPLGPGAFASTVATLPATCSLTGAFSMTAVANISLPADAGGSIQSFGASTRADIPGEQEMAGCLIIIDEDGIDNDMKQVEEAAASLDSRFGGVGFTAGGDPRVGFEITPDRLVNDAPHPGFLCPNGRQGGVNPPVAPVAAGGLVPSTNGGANAVPTEVGNPLFLWNHLVECFALAPDDPDRFALLNTGTKSDPGWFNPPPCEDEIGNPIDVIYSDGSRPPNNGLASCEAWIQAYVEGTLPNDDLDKVENVMPYFNQELEKLVGRMCVAVVHDSDIGINVDPLDADLTSDRYGLVEFEIVGLEVPGGGEAEGNIAESTSSERLYDLWLRFKPVDAVEADRIPIIDPHPDDVSIKVAECSGDTLFVEVERSEGSTFIANPALVTLSVDGTDIAPCGGSFCKDETVDPFLVEEVMTFVSDKTYEFEMMGVDCDALDGRRVVASGVGGGADNVLINN